MTLSMCYQARTAGRVTESPQVLLSPRPTAFLPTYLQERASRLAGWWRPLAGTSPPPPPPPPSHPPVAASADHNKPRHQGVRGRLLSTRYFRPFPPPYCESLPFHSRTPRRVGRERGSRCPWKHRVAEEWESFGRGASERGAFGDDPSRVNKVSTVAIC